MRSVLAGVSEVIFFFTIIPKSYMEAMTLEPISNGKRDLFADLQSLFPLNKDPDIGRDAVQLIASKGYPYESHYITTEDGYILNAVRIPYGRNNSNVGVKRTVAILQHGEFGSCTNFLDDLANQSLAYLLADAGFDVWLPNSRGTSYSRNHTYLNPDGSKFWQFSYDHMAKYDLPAVVNFVVNATGAPQVHYMGHSQGSLIAFICFGQNKMVASRIKHFHALAPVARLKYSTSPLGLYAPYVKEFQFFTQVFDLQEMNIPKEILKTVAGNLCYGLGNDICTYLFSSTFGINSNTFNKSRSGVHLWLNPDSTSTQNFIHLLQGFQNGTFGAYDYGTDEENTRHYGQETPPTYNMTDMTVQMTAYIGGNDSLTDPQDVDWLLSQLTNVVSVKRIPQYYHLDFLWSLDAATLIYSDIIKAMTT